MFFRFLLNTSEDVHAWPITKALYYIKRLQFHNHPIMIDFEIWQLVENES